MKVQLLWFQDCPNHEAATTMLREVLAEVGVSSAVELVEVPDLDAGRRWQFPGSPTIRIDGVDVEPGWQSDGEFTPRCRLYPTADGLRGVPERAWVMDAVRRASSDGAS